MAILIGKRSSGNYGEDLFVEKALEYLDDSYVIYRNRQLYGKEFDICILMPNKGILVVELKGWREKTILRVEDDSIIIQTEEGEVPTSPQKQARGYRFSIQRYIKNALGLNPLVFQMVCLPQISEECYHSMRLDVVTEEKFTILKEDLSTNTAFFKKLDDALREVHYWYRDAFDDKTMRDIRGLFEPDYSVAESQDMQELSAEPYHEYQYSRFYYFTSGDKQLHDSVAEMAREYIKGCKLYAVFSDQTQLKEAASAIDTVIRNHGLVRNRDNLEIDFEGTGVSYPAIAELKRSFSCFHCTFISVDQFTFLSIYICKMSEVHHQGTRM